MKKAKKVLIADDFPLSLDGLKAAIEKHQGFVVSAEASDGETALEKIRKAKPDAAILDIQMPKMGGLEVARILHKDKSEVAVIILTGWKEPEYFREAMKLDVVKGYVLKDNGRQEIIPCLEKVTSGGRYISPLLSDHAAELIKHGKPELEKLTKREKEILRAVAENKTSSEIAKELFLDVKTVQNHRNNICQKLGLHGPNKLLQFAIENKYYLA